MDVILEHLLAAAASPWAPLVVLLVCALDGILPPVPSETTVVAALTLALASSDAAGDVAAVSSILAAAAVGAVIGDNAAYMLGRTLGLERFAWTRRPRARRALELVARRLHRNAATVVLIARYVPIGRVAVNAMAGATRMPWPRFLGLTAIAGIAWAACMLAVATVGAALFPQAPLAALAFAIGLALVGGIAIDRIATRAERRSDAVASASR